MKYFYLIWKSLWRKKARTILTMLSILIAFLLFALLMALDHAFKAGVELSDADRLIIINKVSLIQPLPISYQQRIAAVDGVESVTHSSWFGGYYQDQRNQFPQFPVDTETYFDLYPEFVLLEGSLDEWKANRIGALVGKPVAAQFGWSVGDRVPIQATIFPKTDGDRTWEFEIEGIFDNAKKPNTGNFFLFHYKYFDEARQFGQGTVGWYILRISDVDRAVEIGDDLDLMFANSPAETKTSTEKEFSEAFAKQFGDIGFVIRAVLIAVLFTILLVAANTMAQSVRERIPELAVLKTLGYGDALVLWLILLESILIAVVGGGAGLLLGWLFVMSAAEAFAAFLPGLGIPSDAWVFALALMIAVGVVAGMIPAMQAMRLSIVNALGRH
jgi:putative ABC transport system permease protein